MVLVPRCWHGERKTIDVITVRGVFMRQPTLKSALALDTLEIANQVHPGITTWRNGFPARTGRMIRFTELHDKAVKAALDQNRLQAVIKNVSR